MPVPFAEIRCGKHMTLGLYLIMAGRICLQNHVRNAGQKYRAIDETGISVEYCDADLDKFSFGAYSKNTDNMQKNRAGFCREF